MSRASVTRQNERLREAIREMCDTLENCGYSDAEDAVKASAATGRKALLQDGDDTEDSADDLLEELWSAIDTDEVDEDLLNRVTHRLGYWHHGDGEESSESSSESSSE